MMQRQKINRGRYPVIDGRVSIEIKLKTFNQIFDDRDPAPFRERDLDDEAVEYIVSSFRDAGSSSDFQLVIYGPRAEENSRAANDIITSIHAYFSYESEAMRKRIKSALRIGLISLIIGLAFLTTAVVTMQLIPKDAAVTGSMIKEGLTLLGWVSMWKPINTFLYEWWPLLALKRTYDKLSVIEIKKVLVD